jgi:hypothetical protein
MEKLTHTRPSSGGSEGAKIRDRLANRKLFCSPCTAAPLSWIAELFSETETWNTKTCDFEPRCTPLNCRNQINGLASTFMDCFWHSTDGS